MPIPKKKIKRVKTVPILKNQYVGFQKDIIELPDGTRTEYYLTNRGSRASFVLPVDSRGRLLLLHEYRYPVGRVVIGPVAGAVEKRETPLQTAKRELKEEAGYRARRWSRLGKFYASPGKSDTLFYAYIARDLTPGIAQPDAAEFLEPHWYTTRQVRQLVRGDRIQDGYLLAILMQYSLKKGHL